MSMSDDYSTSHKLYCLRDNALAAKKVFERLSQEWYKLAMECKFRGEMMKCYHILGAPGKCSLDGCPLKRSS